MSLEGLDGKHTLNALVGDVRSLATMLRAIAFTSLCQFTISDQGIQVITEINGALQAIAYLASGIFIEYTYIPTDQDEERDTLMGDDDTEDVPSTIFEVSLTDFLVCMNIYGNAGVAAPGKARDRDEDVARRRDASSPNTQMRLLYKGPGNPLILQLQEGQTQTRCELATFVENTTTITDMPFESESVIGQVIMASKDLTEAFQSIDSSTQTVTFSFMDVPDRKNGLSKVMYRRGGSTTSSAGNRASSSVIFENDEEEEDEANQTRRETIQMMQIRAEGDTGSIELDFPNQYKIFEKFSIIRESSTDYQFANIQRCLKALQSSLKASLRIDEERMMSLQCLFPKRMDQSTYTNNNSTIQMDPEGQGFVELRLTPLANDL